MPSGLSGAASATPALTGLAWPVDGASGLTVDMLGSNLLADDLLMRRGRGADDNGTDDGSSGSGRKKPRIPGGSGCDGAGDAEEHAGCRG